MEDILYRLFRRTSFTFPNVSVFRRMWLIISVVSRTLDRLSSFFMMASVSKPIETAPYSEESVM